MPRDWQPNGIESASFASSEVQFAEGDPQKQIVAAS